jgi:hypothetical protein
LDWLNLAYLKSGADAVFSAIAGGGKDADLGQVFGAGNIEIGLGGLTSGSQKIAIASWMIDSPTKNDSIITVIHESLHAGNADVLDKGYIHQPFFTQLPEDVKLTNAAHFEVVPRRHLNADLAFAGQTFVPAGGGGAGAAPPLTETEKGIRAASESFRTAWQAGLNLHTWFVHVHRTPADWTKVFGNIRFADSMPYWSKVEMLTIHSRAATIDPAGAAAVQPVTLIDLALSEGLIRKLNLGQNSVPSDPNAANTYIFNHGTVQEIFAAVDEASYRDLLIKLVLRKVLGSLTGTEDRDFHVVTRLAEAGGINSGAHYWTARLPADFNH